MQTDKKKPRGRPFTGADDPRLRQNVEAVYEPEVPEPEEEIGDGAPEMLRVLRWAVRNLDARCKGTPQEEHYRRLHKKQPIKFAELFAKLDREFRQAAAKAAPRGTAPAPAEPDEATDRILELTRRTLEELGAKHAEKGECPECGSKLPAGQGRDGRPITNGVHR